MGTFDCFDQSSSLLSRIPLELRRNIYRYALPQSSRVIHVSARNATDQRLAHVPCIAEGGESLHDWDTYHPRWALWGDSHQVCLKTFNSMFGISPGPRKEENIAKVDEDWPSLMLTCREIYCEVRSLLYREISFSLHGDNLVSAHRFFSVISPDALKAIRACNVYWRSQVPMSVRELTSQYYTTDLDLPRLITIESRWGFIAQKLGILSHNKWVNLQVKGHWDLFEMGLSAPPSTIAKKLEEATVQLRWPSEHFAQTADLTAYRLVIQSSTSGEEYTTVKMSPAAPTLRDCPGGCYEVIVHSHPGRPTRPSAQQRFLERRIARESLQSPPS